MTGLEIQNEAYRMFEKWREMFAPDFDGDPIELAMRYARAPLDQHQAAARAAGIKPPTD